MGSPCELLVEHESEAMARRIAYLARDEAWFLSQPEVAGVFSSAGDGGPEDIGGANLGMIFGTLRSRHERERTVQEILAQARLELGAIPGRQIRVFNPAEMMRGASRAQASSRSSSA